MLLSAEKNRLSPVWDALFLYDELVADSSDRVLCQPATAGHLYWHFLTDARSKSDICTQCAAL
jgi:hypothetical protein